MPINVFRYILLFIPVFILLYFENEEIGNLSFSQLWKIPLCFCLVGYVFIRKRKKNPCFVHLYYWLVLKSFLNPGFISNTMTCIKEGLRFAFLPLLYECFNNSKLEIYTLNKILIVLSQYFILTNIPFLFLGLKSRGIGLEYGEIQAYSGIFQNQHAMSLIMSLCILVLLFFMKENYFIGKLSKIYNLFLILLAVYALYLSFARTGWLMCLLGGILLFMPNKYNVKQLFIAVCFMSIVFVGLNFMMKNNLDFRYRVLGINATTNEQMDIGSGRNKYMKYAMDYWQEGNVFELLIGRSKDGLIKYEYARTRMHIGAHNGFVDILACNGILGLLLFLAFLYFLLLFIRKRKNVPIYRLSLCMWVTFLSFQLTQGGNIFHMDIIYALTYAIQEREYKLLNDECY